MQLDCQNSREKSVNSSTSAQYTGAACNESTGTKIFIWVYTNILPQTHKSPLPNRQTMQVSDLRVVISLRTGPIAFAKIQKIPVAVLFLDGGVSEDHDWDDMVLLYIPPLRTPIPHLLMPPTILCTIMGISIQHQANSPITVITIMAIIQTINPWDTHHHFPLIPRLIHVRTTVPLEIRKN